MKKKSIFLLVLFYQIVFSQCKINDIVPFKLGSDRFSTSQILGKIKSIKSETNSESDTYSYWEKPAYLKKDSVYMVIINKRFDENECFKGSENRCQLYIVDDVLYQIKMFQEFKAKDYDKMLNTYNEILKVFDELYPYNNAFKTKNSNTNEKTGEGFHFYESQQNKEKLLPKIKINDISYNITYKKIWNSSSQKRETTSEIDYYTIEISIVDLNGTKLTNEGF